MELLSRTTTIVIALFVLQSFAENICSETIPANRAIDGIPAYSQCSTSTSSAIFSSNGIDTRTTTGGTGWVRTQPGGGYQCTEFAYRYLHFRWNIKSVPGGNAGTWGDSPLPAGLVKTTAPIHGDIIVFGPGSCGAGATTGHVAVIDSVDSATMTIVEQNGASRRKCKVSCARCFIHAETNTGAVSAATHRPDAAIVPFGISVCPTRNGATIQLTGDFAAGSTIRVYNLRGQLVADPTGRIIGGTASFAAVAGSSTSLVVVGNSGRIICRKIATTR